MLYKNKIEIQLEIGREHGYSKIKRIKKEEKAHREILKIVSEKNNLKLKKTRIFKARDDKQAFRAQSKNEMTDDVSQEMDSTTAITASSAGVDLVSRPVTAVAGRLGYMGDHEKSDQTILETSWDLDRILARPSLVTSFIWDPTVVRGYLTTLAIPGDLLTTDLIKTPFNTFMYWRGDVILRIQVTGSPLVQGLLGATFVPLIGQQQLAGFLSLASLTINPTVYLYANTNTVAELRIPYNHYKSYLNTVLTGHEDSLGMVVVYPINQLKYNKPDAGKAVAVNISIFSIFENNEFKIPRMSIVNPESDPVLRRKQISNNVEMRIPQKEQHRVPVFRAQSGLMKGISGLLGSVGFGTSDMVTPAMESVGDSVKQVVAQHVDSNGLGGVIETAAKAAMPTNIIGDMLDVGASLIPGVLSFLGLDNPSVPIHSSQTVVRYNGMMNYAQGPEYIEKLCVNPASMTLVTAESFATLEDEMDMDYLYQRYTYLVTFVQTSDNLVGTKLFSTPITPFQVSGAKAGQYISAIDSSHTDFPLISYLGIPFTYWTGPLAFKLQVIASAMHTARILVSFNFGFSQPKNAAEASSQYGQVIEINQGSNEFEFIVPYVADTPYLYVGNGDNAPSNASITGFLNVTVLNQLAAPNSVAQSVEYNLFMAGAPGFSYFGLGGPNSTALLPCTMPDTQLVSETSSNLIFTQVPPAVPLRRMIYRAQSGATAPTNIAPTVTDTVEVEDETAPPQVDRITDVHFGIIPSSLKDYVKKYQHVQGLPFQQYGSAEGPYLYSLATVNPMQFMILPELAESAAPHGTKISSSGLLTWATAMYRQWKGAVRMKIVLTSLPPGMEARAIFVPYSDYMDVSNITDWHASYISQGSYYSDPYFTTTTIPVPLNTPIANASTMNLLPSDFCVQSIITGPATTLEIEIPWTTIYNTLLTEAPVRFNGTPLNKYTSMGYVAIIVPGELPKGLSGRVYVSFSDEARLGTLYRIPQVFIGGIYDSTGTILAPTYPGFYPVK